MYLPRSPMKPYHKKAAVVFVCMNDTYIKQRGGERERERDGERDREMVRETESNSDI